MNRMTSVIASSICTYLPLTSFINLSHTNQHWRTLSRLPTSVNPSARVFDLACPDADVWLRRVAPHGVVSLTLGWDTHDTWIQVAAMASTLKSLTIFHMIERDILVRLTQLTSLTFARPRDNDEEGDMQWLASAVPSSLRHLEHKYYTSRNHLDTPVVDMVSPSLTSLSFPGDLISPTELHRLLTMVAPQLRHLCIGLATGYHPIAREHVTALLQSATLTSISGVWDSIPVAWIAAGSMSALQRIGGELSLDVVRALATAAPMITAIDNVRINGDESQAGCWIDALVSFKYLNSFGLIVEKYESLCTSDHDDDDYDDDISHKLSPKWLPLVHAMVSLHIDLTMHQCASLSLHTFAPLTRLSSLTLAVMIGSSSSSSSSWRSQLISSLDFSAFGLPKLRHIDLNHSPPGYIWQPFLASLVHAITPTTAIRVATVGAATNHSYAAVSSKSSDTAAMYRVRVTHIDDMRGWLDILSSSPAIGITNRQLQFIFDPNGDASASPSWQPLMEVVTADHGSTGVDVIYLHTCATKSALPFAKELLAHGATVHYMHYLRPFDI